MKRLNSCVLLILGISVLLSCDSKYYPGFCCAKPVPDARIEIRLKEPMLFAELYPRYAKAASSAGFNYLEHYDSILTLEDVTKEYYAGNINTGIMKWWVVPAESIRANRDKKPPLRKKMPSYRVSFMEYYLVNGERDLAQRLVSSITFVFRAGRLDGFTIDHWAVIFKFYRESIPDSFEGVYSDLSISRHPAVFTDDETLAQIQKETDFDIPVRYLERNEEP